MNNKQNNTNNKSGRVLAVPSLCEFYPGICLTTEGKAWKNLSQGFGFYAPCSDVGAKTQRITIIRLPANGSVNNQHHTI
jgi:hypothetical protein